MTSLKLRADTRLRQLTKKEPYIKLTFLVIWCNLLIFQLLVVFMVQL